MTAFALTDDFAIENYTGLQEFLTDHLELSPSTVAQLPNLIRMAEYRFNRLLLTPERETETTLSTTAGVQAVALPTGYRQTKQLKIEGYPLEPVSLNTVETYDSQGKPLLYAISGLNILLGPVPDATYTLTLRYIEKLEPLGDANLSNWLLADHADAYIYMSCATICDHLGDTMRAAMYNSYAERVMEEINEAGVRQRGRQPMRLRSPVVV